MKRITILFSFLLMSSLAFSQFSGGKGTRMEPYRVATAADLNNVRNCLDCYYIQVADIDLSEFPCWEPIGSEGAFSLFTGFYNGADFDISNLRIDRPVQNHVGLFGYVGPGTSSKPVVIRNVHLRNVNVAGGSATGSLVGTVMGNIYTLIENCSVAGERGHRMVSGNAGTGGLVGANHGVSMGELSGDAFNTIISKCYADVDVAYSGMMPGDGKMPRNFGGLVGDNEQGSIFDSYAYGAITINCSGSGICNIGGLAGNNSNYGVIERSYSTGLITTHDAQQVGGLIGVNCNGNGISKGSVVNSFWDIEASGVTNSPAGYGLTTPQMQQKYSFSGFSFDRIWDMGSSNNGYPSLKRVAGSTYITWTGAKSTEWNHPGNWNEGRLPVNRDIVVIPDDCPNFPVITTAITGPAAPEGISISNRAKLTIAPSGSLTVLGSFQNNANESGLVILSDENGTGSLIQGSGNLRATVNQYLSASEWGESAKGWHIISSPVTAQIIDEEWAISGPESDYVFYHFDEGAAPNYWEDMKNVGNFSTFQPGEGYFVAFQHAGVRTYSGIVNHNAVSLSNMSYTPSSSFAGFHLMGNPFTSAIDWNSPAWEKLNIPNASMYIWNPSTASYLTTVQTDGIIPAMNGFMIYTNGNGKLTIPAEAKVHSTKSFYKNSDQYIQLDANDLENNISQSSIVRFHPQATEGFDEEFDAHFLAGFAPMFYSRSWDAFLALNTYKSLDETMCIPFGFVKNSSQLFNIELTKTIPGTTIYLTDRKQNHVINLSQLPVYSFTSEDGDDPDRFLLHFAPLSVNDKTIDNPIRLVVIDNSLIVSGISEQSEVMLTSITGQTISRTRTGNEVTVTLNTAGLSSGIYIVTVISGKGAFSQKVVL